MSIQLEGPSGREDHAMKDELGAAMHARPGTVRAWWHPMDFGGLPPIEGPWTHEPSKVQWVDEWTGLPCLIVRAYVGHLCGYVGVSAEHPFYGVHPDDDRAPYELDAHGGVNFAAGCAHGEDESRGVCHVPEPGMADDVWWLGFDCGHIGEDVCPQMEGMMRELDMVHGKDDRVYRTIGYVRDQVGWLALQIAPRPGNGSGPQA